MKQAPILVFSCFACLPGLLAPGCNQQRSGTSSPSSPSGGEPMARRPPPPRAGDPLPPRIEPTLAEKTCSRDADCTLTLLSPGTCCTHGCSLGTPVTTAFLDRLQKVMTEHCRDSKPDCPVWSCPPFGHRAVARCVKGACVSIKEPLCPREKEELARLEPQAEDESTCQRDEDCVFTRLANGSCCKHVCGGIVMPRAFEARLGRFQDACCVGRERICERARCVMHKKAPRCREGKCVGEPLPK